MRTILITAMALCIAIGVCGCAAPPILPGGTVLNMSVDKFISMTRSGSARETVDYGTSIFVVGAKIPDHARLFSAFKTRQVISEEGAKVQYSIPIQGGKLTLLTVRKDTGEIISFGALEFRPIQM